jgi:hypothetical protein
MWKKSILETPKEKPATTKPSQQVLHTEPSTDPQPIYSVRTQGSGHRRTDTPMINSTSPNTHVAANRSPQAKFSPSANAEVKQHNVPIEQDLEASINDKIANKMKELLGGKATPTTTTPFSTKSSTQSLGVAPGQNNRGIYDEFG